MKKESPITSGSVANADDETCPAHHHHHQQVLDNDIHGDNSCQHEEEVVATTTTITDTGCTGIKASPESELSTDEGSDDDDEGGKLVIDCSDDVKDTAGVCVTTDLRSLRKRRVPEVAAQGGYVKIRKNGKSVKHSNNKSVTLETK